MSTSALKLARDGGKPVRSTPLPYSRQSIDADDIKMVNEALTGDLITCGPWIEKFERAIGDYVKMPYAVAFNSATSALHATMAMLGVGPGQKVVTSPITFAATSNSVLYCGGEVVFKDVEASTMNLNPKTLGDLNGVKVVTAVDFSGNPCRYDELREIQKKHNHSFALVDDASHSLGGLYRGAAIGAQADVSIFSFHPVKSCTTGEGGVAVVHDKAQADFLKAFRAHGIFKDGRPGFYEQRFLGYNFRITDLQCALGISQVKKLPRFMARRNELAQAYHQKLKDFDFLELPQVTDNCMSSWHLYPVRLRHKNAAKLRDDFLKALIAENIFANVHYIPVYWHPHYQKLGFKRGLCPIAEDAYLREISIPLFPLMEESDIDDVVKALEKVATILE